MAWSRRLLSLWFSLLFVTPALASDLPTAPGWSKARVLFTTAVAAAPAPIVTSNGMELYWIDQAALYRARWREGGWSQPELLRRAAGSVDQPYAFATPQGPLLVWVEHRFDGSGLRAFVMYSWGDFTPQQAHVAPHRLDNFHAAYRAGRGLVTWVETRGGQTTVMVYQIGGQVVPAVRRGEEESGFVSPSLGFDEAGGVYLAYLQEGRLFLRPLGEDLVAGPTLGLGFALLGDRFYRPLLAPAPGGGVYLLWNSESRASRSRAALTGFSVGSATLALVLGQEVRRLDLELGALNAAALLPTAGGVEAYWTEENPGGGGRLARAVVNGETVTEAGWIVRSTLVGQLPAVVQRGAERWVFWQGFRRDGRLAILVADTVQPYLPTFTDHLAVALNQEPLTFWQTAPVNLGIGLIFGLLFSLGLAPFLWGLASLLPLGRRRKGALALIGAALALVLLSGLRYLVGRVVSEGFLTVLLAPWATWLAVAAGVLVLSQVLIRSIRLDIDGQLAVVAGGVLWGTLTLMVVIFLRIGTVRL